MSTVGNVGNNYKNYTDNKVNNNHPGYNNSKPAEEKKKENGTEVVEDEFVKSDGKKEKLPTYSKPTITPDMDKINELKAELKNNMGAFKMMLQSMNGDSENKFDFADPTNVDQLRQWIEGVSTGQITYDAETINKAKEAIGEDGEWGAEAVSDRIVEFAKAISGGDIDQYDKLIDAIEKGFGGAKEAWGKEMPEITKQTYDKTMEKMEAWKKEATAANTTTEDAVTAASGAATK